MYGKEQLLVSIALFLLLVEKSIAIRCYQCASTDPSRPFQCNEFLSDDVDIADESCDGVHGAQYCIKHVGRFEGFSIQCYQCSSSKLLDCSDGMIHMTDLEPESCDHVFEAQYCIKAISLDGGIGTKRFCSSLNLGNYCNFVQQRGDKLMYRTCVYTCTGDSCNSGHLTRSNFIVMTSLLTILYFFSCR